MILRLSAMLVLASAVAARAEGAAPQLIRIATARSELTLAVANDGRVYQLGYGRVNQQLTAPAKTPNRLEEFYPQAGDGFICEPALQATHADGNTSTDLRYVQHHATTNDNVIHTRLELKDPAYPFFVAINFRAYQREDVIEQWTETRHEESGPVTLYRFASSSPLIPRAQSYWLTHFHGDWAREAQWVEEPLASGMKVLDSKIGVRAHQFRTPVFLLALDHAARENQGEVYGGALAWSGSFQFAFEIGMNDRLRALAGINPFGSQYHLARGETFTTPAMLWTWSDQGKGRVSRNFHRWARRYGIRDGDLPRPVLLNNWEATDMNFDENLIVSLFDGAKEIGAETFLLDDGWFGNRHPRNRDNAGLGDWQVNTNKLPRGLGHLAVEAKRRGVNFGIWIEPEMVNPRSDLFAAHPDWVIRQPHRELELSRNQLTLDLSRPEVREFAWGVVHDTLSTPGVSYVKWDANRFVTQPGSPYLPPERQSHLLVDYNRALYDVMGRMARQHPNVMAMLCSGGGGRVDYGALKFFHSFWPSDNTDPVARVKMQWGYSHFFPASAISAHVTHMGKRPLKFALDVAMSGALGVDMDVRKLSPGDRQFLAAGIALYKDRLRDVVQQGDLYRLESPHDGPRAALNYVSADRRRAVLFVYQLRSAPPAPVKLNGLDPEARYRVEELNLRPGTTARLEFHGRTMDGQTLMTVGFEPPCEREFDSAVIALTREP